MEEVWKVIEGYEGRYQVSNQGRVRSIDRSVKNKQSYAHRDGCILKQYINKGGYCDVYLYTDSSHRRKFRVHRLVAMAFIPMISDKYQVDHINANRDDNRVENLRWVTPKENSNNPIAIAKHKSYHYSEETKRKISEAQLGKHHSDESKRKMSEARKRYWERKRQVS